MSAGQAAVISQAERRRSGHFGIGDVSLPGALLPGTLLSGASLSGALLSGASLPGASLSGTGAYNTKFRKTVTWLIRENNQRRS
ncbi:MAG: pentapeptide repeat-containing protein [Clostridia bacterium]|nr:pentapeptide repeat-containing protein [Clostridia bacterium]